MPATTYSSGPRPIVGREREQAQLRACLDRALDGSSSLTLVSGEAGIGKTTLVSDLMREAEKRGALVLTGGCYDLTTTPPYGPWIEAIRAYQPTAGLPPVPDWFGNAAELERIGSQAALFEATRDFFSAVAAVQPLVLVLEDLHWSDGPSLAALRHVAMRIASDRLLIIATYRDDELTRRHELFQLLPLLVRESGAQRVHLNRLDAANVDTLISTRYTLSPADHERLSAYVAERSDGNPFFAGELLYGLEEEQVLVQAADGWMLRDLSRAHVPSLLRSVIESRLGRLAEETRELLEIAAVIGQSVPFDLWAEVAALDEGALVRAIEDGVHAQLIEELPSRDGIRFRHALVRETLHAGIVGVRLRARHRVIAETLAVKPGADPDAVSHHFAEAGDPRQIDWLLRAGRRAERAYAWLEAIQRYEQAARLMEADDSWEMERGWTLFEISELSRYAAPRQGLAYAQEARRIGIDNGDRWLAALALFRAGFLANVITSDSDSIDSTIEACTAIDEGIRACHQGTDDAGWLMSKDRVPDLIIADALGTLDKVDDSARLNFTWGTVVSLLVTYGRFAEAREIGSAALPVATWGLQNLNLAHRVRRTLGFVDLKLALAVAHAAEGNLHASRDMFSDALADYRRYGHYVMARNVSNARALNLDTPFFGDDPRGRDALLKQMEQDRERSIEVASASDLVRPADAIAAFISGRWEAARTIAERGLNDETMWSVSKQGFTGLMTAMNHAQGDRDEAWSRIGEMLRLGHATEPGATQFHHSIQLQRLAVDLALDADDPDTARAWLQANDRWLAWSGIVPGRAEGQLGWARYYRETDDGSEARARAEQALAHASDPRQPLALVAAHRFLGQLDIDDNRLDGAGTHLTASLELAERCEAPFEQALTMLVMAEAAAKAGKVDETRDLLRRVREICEPLEARPTLERADAIETLLSSRPAQTYPAGLTEREVEVLRLIAQGLTDAEAAERLFISPRTVGQHLRSVYNKLGVSSRTAAAIAARDYGLV